MLVGKFRDQRQPHTGWFRQSHAAARRVALAGDQIMQLDAIDLSELALRCLRQRRADIEQCDR